MKHFILIATILMLNSCYVYKAYEPNEDEEVLPLKQQIQQSKMYELTANGQTYKLEAVAWEGDSLLAHVDRKEDQPIKLHKDDISNVQHRVFSRGRSDAFTVGIYAGIAGIIILLTQ